MKHHSIIVRTKTNNGHLDVWGRPVEGAVDVLDMDVVLTRWDDELRCFVGTGFFSGIEFKMDTFSAYAQPDYDHWAITDYRNDRYFRDGEPIALPDLRHHVRTLYLEASGDTDLTPTSAHSTFSEIRHDLWSYEERTDEIRRVTLQRWPGIDQSFIPKKIKD